MNKSILLPEVQSYISQNLNADTKQMLLKKSPFSGISISELVIQIESKKRCKNKLPLWFKTPNIYYPPTLSIEQTSSEETARYKANLVSGNLVDITGGMGIDSYFFAQKTNRVVYCELQTEVSKTARHNFRVLGQENIECYTGNGFDFLEKSNQKQDWIYADPARRDSQKNKVFLLSDSEPNIIEILPFLWKYTDAVLLKTSPMSDISLAIKELSNVTELHIVAVKNEVKELLWILNKSSKNQNIKVKTINILPKENETFNFIWGDEETAKATFHQPQSYLYEPNASLMKSGAFKLISQRLEIHKLHLHSHLYTSDKLIPFLGRRFQVKEIQSFSKKNLKKYAKANITTRNFPIPIADIRKQNKIKEGGDIYIFLTTNCKNEKIILVCEKVK